MRLHSAFVLLAVLLLVAGCSRTPWASSPLIQAAREGDAAAIQRLLAAGADPDRPGGSHGWTPLIHAIHKNQRDSVEALLDGGADMNRKVGHGATALMLAAGCGRTDLAELLLDNGADPYARTVHGVSALDFALLGVAELDAFTALDCQTATVELIRERAPGLTRYGSLTQELLLKLKNCPEY